MILNHHARPQSHKNQFVGDRSNQKKMSESQSQRLKTIRTFSKRTQAGMNATFLANNVQVQQSAQSEALAGDARISAISKKLTAFKSTHKKIFVKTEHQFDWRREFSNLKDAENKAGKVTSAALVSLLEVINTQKRLGDYKTDGEVVGDVEILIADQNIIVTNKVPSSVTNVYKSKLAELRTILGELKEGKTNTNAANANGEAQKYATSLFAELLLRCHEQLSSEEQLLEKELEECLVEEKQTRLAVMKSLRGYNEEEDGNEEEELPAVLTNQFTEGGFEEHIEVQLLREELRAKFVEAKRKNETEYSIENKYTEANNSSDKQLFTDSDSTTFTKIIKDWERTSKKGGLKKVTERMKLELPHKSSGEISANIDAYNRRNFETTHKKNADVNLKRVLAQLTEFGIKRINAVKEGIKVNITQEIIGKINATMRQEQQARLTVLRAAREEARRIEEEKEKKLREELKEVSERTSRNDDYSHRTSTTKLRTFPLNSFGSLHSFRSCFFKNAHNLASLGAERRRGG